MATLEHTRRFPLSDLQLGIDAIAKLVDIGWEGETSDLRDRIVEETGIAFKTAQRVTGLAVEVGMLAWDTTARYRTRCVVVGKPFDVEQYLKQLEKEENSVATPRKKGFGLNLNSLDGGITAGAAIPVGQRGTYEKAIEEERKKAPKPAAPQGPVQITHSAPEPQEEPQAPAQPEWAHAEVPAARPSRDSMILRLGTDLKEARERIAELEVEADLSIAAHARLREQEKEITSLTEQLKASLDKIAQQEVAARTLKATVNELMDAARAKDRELDDLKAQLKQAWQIAAQAKPEFDNAEADLLSHLYPDEFK